MAGGGAQEAASAAAAVLGPTTLGSKKRGDSTNNDAREGQHNHNHNQQPQQQHHAHSMIMTEAEEAAMEAEEGGFGLAQPPVNFGLAPVRNGSLWTTLSFGWVDGSKGGLGFVGLIRGFNNWIVGPRHVHPSIHTNLYIHVPRLCATKTNK